MAGPRRSLGRCAALLGVAAMATWAGAPASATVIDRDTFADSEIGVADEICGIPVIRDSTSSGSFRVRVDKASAGQAFLGRVNVTYRDVLTNPSNGKSLTFEGRFLESEIKATHVEGNVYAFTFIQAGQLFTVRDAAGNVVLRDRGVIRFMGTLDTLGDGVPGGISLGGVEVLGVGGPHPGFDQSEAEFCAMVDDLIG